MTTLRLARAFVSIVVLLCLVSGVVHGADVTLAPEKKLEPISPYIYGQFVEHLGKSIHGGLWAEMIQDRKFYFPVTDKFDPWGTATDPQWNTGPYKYLKASPWQVIGPVGSVTMDSTHPFAGSQSPAIHSTDGNSPAGILQDGLAFVAGKKYSGRIVLRGQNGTYVAVRFIFDDGKAVNQAIYTDGGDFRPYPIEFTAPSSAENGRVEIRGTADSKFAVGTTSLMSQDNIDGWRTDVVNLLKQLNSPVYRWPGGNFVSGYDWKDGLGDRDKRPPRKNPAWKGVESNDVGIHEFMNLMKIINSEPYVALNTGLGNVQQAVDEVQYLNGAADTSMGKLRVGNGQAEPFHVKFFAVGNEMFGSWQLGHMSIDQYVLKNNSVVDEILKVDPSAQLVAVGNVGRWDQAMLSNCADHMTFLSEHIYCKEKQDVDEHTAQLAQAIAQVAAAHRQYLNDMPTLKDHHIRLAMDEWNYWYGDYLYGELGCQYHLKDALGIARGLHEYFRNTDLFFMANYAQTVNVLGAIKTNRTDASLEATALVLQLYRNQFGTIPIQVMAQPTNLDVSAAWTADKSAFTLAIVNCTENADKVTLKSDLSLVDHGAQWIITGAKPDDCNVPGAAPQVTLVKKDFAASRKTFPSPPLSVVLYRLEKK